MSKPHVLILGGGPAGLGGAFKLRRLDRAEVTVLEQRDSVGGNSGSFEAGGQYLDYGSHRLHPASDPAVLQDIQELLGSDLVERQRHGRISLRGKWIHFPLKPVDLMLRLDPGFAVGSLRDMALKRLSSPKVERESFASVLMGSLGPTICRDFYFPYARKIWGRDPEELAAVQAKKRVSANSFTKLLRKVLAQVPGVPRGRTGYFFYPRKGFGQISQAYADDATEHGAKILLGHTLTRLEFDGDGWNAKVAHEGGELELRADYVWSTIPVTVLAKIVQPAPAAEVIGAAADLEYRSMLLVYLELPCNQFTEFDAHYFPGADLQITRLSEPKNYSGVGEPVGRTTLCAEIPCSVNDAVWKASETELGELVAADLKRAQLPLPAAPTKVFTRRLSHAYPIYLDGYDAPFAALDAWASDLPRLLSYGRQGLFAHDNTHHALFMAYSAADCLVDGEFDEAKWQRYRGVFESHVVED